MADKRYFIVKHDLESFKALPNYIWRTQKRENGVWRPFPKNEVPQRFREVKRGDLWIGFAYTNNDNHERSLSHVKGFYECVKVYQYLDVPPRPEVEKGWFIEGKKYGEQPKYAVGVPPIDDLLGRTLWKNQALVPINFEDFDRIQRYTFKHQYDITEIPLFGREPLNEQEVLAIVVAGHKQLGIERIVQVGKAFPDLLVHFKGHSTDVHLELEVYSSGFFSHGHHMQVKARNIKKDKVAVLCWIDNLKGERKQEIRKHVHDVYVLQDLFRERSKIDWK